MSTKGVDPAPRLAFEVKWRRANLDLSQMEVWQAGGPSNTTLTTIENGRLPDLTRATARKLDKALQWEQGSAMRVWNGEGKPTPVGASLEGDGYVSATGDVVEGGASNDEVLRAIRAMRAELNRLEGLLERVEKLDEPRP